jgi:hypothetical protein
VTRRRIGLALLGLLAVGSSVLAQAPDADIPRTREERPDFSGIWQTLSPADYDLEPHAARDDAPPGVGVVEGGRIPYQPWALEHRAKNFAARATADPRTSCYTLGTPRGIYYPEPLQIFQRPRDLTIMFQFGHPVRTIHTNGTEHPDGPFRFWLGDSRGGWDGDTLVVDVADFTDETWLDRAGNFHSDALHVVERWRLLDRNTIEYRARLTDPKVFTGPWTIAVLLHRVREPNAQLIEHYCSTLPYQEFYPFPKETR